MKQPPRWWNDSIGTKSTYLPTYLYMLCAVGLVIVGRWVAGKRVIKKKNKCTWNVIQSEATASWHIPCTILRAGPATGCSCAVRVCEHSFVHSAAAKGCLYGVWRGGRGVHVDQPPVIPELIVLHDNTHTHTHTLPKTSAYLLHNRNIPTHTHTHAHTHTYYIHYTDSTKWENTSEKEKKRAQLNK